MPQAGDVRAVCGMFGISISIAYRYSANASTGTNGAEPGPTGKQGPDDNEPLAAPEQHPGCSP
jgi:hypothetical protein